MSEYDNNITETQAAAPSGSFETINIPISDLYRNSLNFYNIEDIEDLANDILLYGLKQNLEVVHAPSEEGEYRIVSGERRYEALKHLVEQGYTEFDTATCKLTEPQNEAEEQIELIIANSYRSKTPADLMEEEKRLRESLQKLKDEGKKIRGFDLETGRLRDVIASILRVSGTKVAQLDSVNSNLIPELKDKLKNDEITFSAAYELSGMSEEEQQDALDKHNEGTELTHKTVKEMKKKSSDEVSAGGSFAAVSGGGTDDAAPEYSYETPHPESVTSLCYSCTEYETCDVKTGTCTSCDQYRNRKEAYKTDEQRYNEEQDRIDRETKKKLEQMSYEGKMSSMPSDHQQEETKVHKVQMGASFFEEILDGARNFELRKNEDYKEGEFLEILEMQNGSETGRSVKALITYVLSEYKGLEEDYCVLALRVIEKNLENIDETC